MKHNFIFEPSFLKLHLDLFQLSQIDGIDTKRNILNDWLLKIQSGRIDASNETAIGADFINDIFGDVLGFNFRNPFKWNLEKELKTAIDGQKPDGAIGYFGMAMDNDVRGIIELKDSDADLDKKQKRINKRTPIEQAFGYAPKYGDNCKWVIVSNFKEIRLYCANDATRYEVFFIEKLADESELKRFFFLLKNEQLLVQQGSSRLERLIEKNKESHRQTQLIQSGHMLDVIYYLIKKFDGLYYVNPNIIANAPPFNNSNDYVWHYDDFALQSSEEGIYELFKEIIVESQSINISQKLKNDLKEKGVTEGINKIEFIIKRLNDFAIFRIQCYENPQIVRAYFDSDNVIGGSMRVGMTNHSKQLKQFSIDYREHDKVCDCVRCCYSKLDFATLLKTLKTQEGTDKYYTLESGYMHHIFATNNFKTSYLIFKAIVEKEKNGNEFLYFIAKYNLRSLHNLVESYYDLDDKAEIMEYVKSIDLDFIFQELDLIDHDKRKALIEIKEQSIQKKTEKEVEEKIVALKRVKSSFKRGDRGSFPNYTQHLNQPYASFLLNYLGNFILGNTFRDYKALCKKTLKAYLISYTVSTKYYGRLKEFKDFHLNIILFDISPTDVEQLFCDCKVDDMVISEKAKTNLLEKVVNFLQSNHRKKTFWGEPMENEYISQALKNYHFKQIYEHLFSNIFFILGRIELTKEDCRKFIPILIKFLEIDETLYQGMLKPLRTFITRYGMNFLQKELIKILKLTIEKIGLNGVDFVQTICLSIKENYPNTMIEDDILIQKAILNFREKNLPYKYLISFWTISNRSNQLSLEKIFFEKLDNHFAPSIYRNLLLEEVIDIEFKDYFRIYIKSINTSKRSDEYTLWDGEPQLQNFEFINFALVVYILDIDTQDSRFQEFSGLCDWQEWLINLERFDYSKFKGEWILIFHHEVFLKKFGEIPKIKKAVEAHLKQQYHTRLSEIFVKYLL